eukprot:924414-Amphidinium_carterae.1
MSDPFGCPLFWVLTESDIRKGAQRSTKDSERKKIDRKDEPESRPSNVAIFGRGLNACRTSLPIKGGCPWGTSPTHQRVCTCPTNAGVQE